MSVVNRGNEKTKGNSTKYIHFILIAAAFAAFMYFSAAPNARDVRVYQFSGRCEFGTLSGGIIAVSDRDEVFIGGNLIINEGFIAEDFDLTVEFYSLDVFGDRHNIFAYRHSTGPRISADTTFIALGGDYGLPLILLDENFILKDILDDLIIPLFVDIHITWGGGMHQTNFLLHVRDIFNYSE
ncbi:MAG: hypothetical protein FWE24_06245 [Defluviitaleaceae bacterium]|nr:hypothetical protein [Defluviitaleaceae bacterium]